MSGGVRNVYVSGCSFVGTDVGLRFKSTRGRGGVVENIFIDNINMIDISNDALTMDLYYAVNDFPETPIPDVRKLLFSGTFIFQMFFAEVRNGQYISTGCRKCLLRISLSKT
jgi:polygalacturonase